MFRTEKRLIPFHARLNYANILCNPNICLKLCTLGINGVNISAFSFASASANIRKIVSKTSVHFVQFTHSLRFRMEFDV